MFVNTSAAAFLLDVCSSRIRQLLLEGRVLGAVKVGRFWQIPLFDGMPEIIDGTRGPKSSWKTRLRKVMTRIHINKHKLDSNRKHNELEPIIAVRRGSDVEYCHSIEIKGSSKLVYRPEKPLSCCKNAVLWIEVEPNIEVVMQRI